MSAKIEHVVFVAAAGFVAACASSGQIGRTEPSAARANGARNTPALTAAEAEELRWAVDTGRRLYELDTVSAIASDIVIERLSPADREGTLGWLATQTDERRFVVTFYRGSLENIEVLADVRFVDGEPPELQQHPARSASAFEIAAFRARQTGLAAGRTRCSDRFNPVVIPRADGGFDVYVLAATANEDEILVGGHTRVDVSADGLQVNQIQAFSRSCLVLSKRNPDLPPGDEVVGLAVTHIVSRVPAPTHVFLSLLHRTEFYVGTAIGVWKVTGADVRLILDNP